MPEVKLGGVTQVQRSEKGHAKWLMECERQDVSGHGVFGELHLPTQARKECGLGQRVVGAWVKGPEWAEPWPQAMELRYILKYHTTPLPGGLVVKNLPANTGDADSIPRSGRSHGVGNGNPLQYSCLRNPVEREPGSL